MDLDVETKSPTGPVGARGASWRTASKSTLVVEGVVRFLSPELVAARAQWVGRSESPAEILQASVLQPPRL